MEIHSQRVSGLLDETTERLEASGSETARLDAEVLLGYILGVDRSVLMAHPEAVISTGQLERFEPCVARRAAGEEFGMVCERGHFEFEKCSVVVVGVTIPL